MKKIGLILITLLCCCSLEEAEDPLTVPGIRTIVEHSNSDRYKVYVFLEGNDGQSVTGALVYLVNNNNTHSLLQYDFTEGCYTLEPDYLESGTYNIVVKSRAFKESREEIVFSRVSESPTIEILQDSIGNNALTGDYLTKNRDISISWEGIENTTSYTLSIFISGSLVNTIVTTENNYILSGLDKSGSYSISIKAQAINGDPLFIEKSYYTVSERVSSNIYWIIE